MQRLLLTLLLACAVPLPAAAEVQQSRDEGFVVGGVHTVSVAPQDVWALLVRPADWWEPSHTWSGDAANMAIDGQGCFCEMLPDSGGMARHMQVVHARPPARLVMNGALGPLQAEAVTGVLTVEIAPAEHGGSRLTWTYVVGGYSRTPLSALAAPVDMVMTAQFRRLAQRLDHE